ncbi:MAG TPA: nucleotide exchange factor GrpE [Magnetovibrio sp.]
MSDDTQKNEQQAQADAEANAQADAERDMAQEAAAEAAEIAAEADAGEAAAANEGNGADLAAEVQDLKDKLLRAMADAENTRRIAAREKADAAKYAVTNFARDILRVADNLGFAMMSVSQEARQADKNLDNLYVGIDMTMKELLSVFEGNGIKPVPAEGQPFDHNIHEAVQQVENPDVAAGTVMQVLRRGFTLQDRLLRPAQVIVSVGGAKADAAAEPTENPEVSDDKGQKAYEKGAQASGHAVDQET